MKISFLCNTGLFKGLSEAEISEMFKILKAESKNFSKGEYLYRMGDRVKSLGLLLSGGVNIESDDPWGNTGILGHLEAGEIFAETYACFENKPLMVNVVATEPTEVLFINLSSIFDDRDSIPHSHKLMKNLILIMATKNLNLSQRIFNTSSKTIRGRIISYLSFRATEEGSLKLTVPFNRQQLADYLGVDRSALSNELSKMRREGLITVNKNQFVLSPHSKEEYI